MSFSVAAALARAKALGVERLDAQLLLAHHLGCKRVWLLGHADAPVPSTAASAFDIDCRRRADDVPLAYLLGQREFHGLTLALTPDVLVPRPDTETLVDWALGVLDQHREAWPLPEVLDLGTGSGAIALALKQHWPQARLGASDASVDALAVARCNGERLQLQIDWRCGDWWQPWGAARFHLVVSNPPYIGAADEHLLALRHEPLRALSPGADPLSAIERIIEQAVPRLLPGGWLLLEHGHQQAAAVCQRLRLAGFSDCRSRADLAGHLRCSGGRV